jgi:hypothetical protein
VTDTLVIWHASVDPEVCEAISGVGTTADINDVSCPSLMSSACSGVTCKGVTREASEAVAVSIALIGVVVNGWIVPCSEAVAVSMEPSGVIDTGITRHESVICLLSTVPSGVGIMAVIWLGSVAVAVSMASILVGRIETRPQASDPVALSIDVNGLGKT